jgi:hypothetical protein
MQIKDKTISSRIEKSIDESLYEIIEFNESEPIIFQKDKKKKQQQSCKTAKNESNKEVILVIPSEFTSRRINN